MKDPEERRSEILDTAERLFNMKGYSQTTIMDILNDIGIAKGTFYYYFKSKEEELDAIIMRIINADVATATKIARDPALPAIPKLLAVLSGQKPKNGNDKDKMLQQFQQPSNAEMRQKSLVQAIVYMTPVLTQVVKQGVDEHVMSTDHPREAVECLIAFAEIILDNRLFLRAPEEAQKKPLPSLILWKLFWVRSAEVLMGYSTYCYNKCMH